MHIVGGDQHRHPHFVEAFEQFHDLDGEVGIEIAGGLVGNEQRRLRDHRARDAHTLLLAGRELEGSAFLLAEQADLIERSADALVDFALRHAGDDQRQGDVVRHGPVVQQLVILKYHANASAKLGDAAGLYTCGILVVDEHLAAGRALDERDQFQDAALAGTGVARQKRQLAVIDLERHAGQGLAAGGVALVDLVETDHARAPLGADFSRADTESDALNTPKSWVSSPTPTKRMGILSFWAMAWTTPPLAVPSSLVTTRPVTPNPLWNSSACATAFWPMVPSSTNRTSCGAPGSRRPSTRLTFLSSSIRCVWVCRRPAVSAIRTS